MSDFNDIYKVRGFFLFHTLNQTEIPSVQGLLILMGKLIRNACLGMLLFDSEPMGNIFYLPAVMFEIAK